MSSTIVLGPSGKSNASEAFEYLDRESCGVEGRDHVASRTGHWIASDNLEGESDSQNVSAVDSSKTLSCCFKQCSGSTMSDTYKILRLC